MSSENTVNHLHHKAKAFLVNELNDIPTELLKDSLNSLRSSYNEQYKLYEYLFNNFNFLLKEISNEELTRNNILKLSVNSEPLENKEQFTKEVKEVLKSKLPVIYSLEESQSMPFPALEEEVDKYINRNIKNIVKRLEYLHEEQVDKLREYLMGLVTESGYDMYDPPKGKHAKTFRINKLFVLLSELKIKSGNL